MNKIIHFFIDNFPPLNAIAIGGPLGLIWAWLCLYLCGYLKMAKRIETGYTRKAFHFLIFSTVVLIHVLWGLPVVCLFGGMTTVVVFYAVLRGAGHMLYEAMAREKDAPRRTYYVIVPYFSTLIGGLISNIHFAEFAVVGYLVAGLGDATGEVIGTRFGKHAYRIIAFGGVRSTRSYEGSVAVFMMCMVAIVIGILLNPQLELGTSSLFVIPLFGIVCTILEAVSPQGWDNAVLQIIPSFLASHLL